MYYIVFTYLFIFAPVNNTYYVIILFVMFGCNYVSKDSPFVNPDGYSFCFYYCVFCSDTCNKCPFDYLPSDLVKVDEFGLYPAKNVYIQLSLF